MPRYETGQNSTLLRRLTPTSFIASDTFRLNMIQKNLLKQAEGSAIVSAETSCSLGLIARAVNQYAAQRADPLCLDGPAEIRPAVLSPHRNYMYALPSEVSVLLTEREELKRLVARA